MRSAFHAPRSRRARLMLAALVAGLGVMSAVTGAAQEPGDPTTAAAIRDYATDNGDWNGLQDFTVLARAQGAQLTIHKQLDYDKLNLDEPLIVLYPKQRLRAASLSRFVVDGGRVLLADDFGYSEELLARLDLTRLMPNEGALPHDEFVNQNPALPILRPRGIHPLLKDVEVLVANHPAVLFNVGGPVVPYSESGGLVYDMNLGKGKVIVMADASLFINHMVLMADNDKLLRNSIDYLCKEQPNGCKLNLVVGDFEQTGAYGHDGEGGLLGLGKTLFEDIDSINETISKAMKDLPTQQLFYYLSILLVAGLAVYLYTIFPVRKTRPYSAYLSDQRERFAYPQSEFDWNLSRFMHGYGGVTMNYALPVAILKELFEQLFLTSLGSWDDHESATRPTVTELGALFRERHLKHHNPAEAAALEQEVIDLLAQLARVPTRHRIFMDNEVHFSERELLKIHSRCLQILEIMDLKDEYDRRTRHTV